MDDTLADLWYISQYALEVRRQLKEGKPPTQGYLNRMRDLAEKVQRQFDLQLEEMGNAQA